MNDNQLHITKMPLISSQLSEFTLFNDLPPELHLRTCTFLTRYDLRSLSRSSRYFFYLVSRDLLIADLQYHRSSETLLCLLKYPLRPAPPSPSSNSNTQTTYIYAKRSRALQIQHNPGPFIIRDVEIGSSSDAISPGPIKLHIYRPVFWRPDANERSLDLRVDLTAVSLVHREPEMPSGGGIVTGSVVISSGTEEDDRVGEENGGTGSDYNGGIVGGDGDKSVGAVAIRENWRTEEWRRRDPSRDAIIEYGKETRAGGGLALLTARMLRASYTCPECRGQRFIKRPSAQDTFHARWPGLDCAEVVDMPCPCCVGYDYAAEACDYHNSEDEWPSVGLQVKSMVNRIRREL